MTDQADITVLALFHTEGALAITALASMQDMVQVARAAGITVEARAVLDRGDVDTRHFIAVRGAWLDQVSEVSFGHAGPARNAGAQAARGRYLSFLDGDDLWGSNWLLSAYKAASEAADPREVIWHPEYLYFFTEADFYVSSLTSKPHPKTQAFFKRQTSSDQIDFNPAVLKFNNYWSANAFGARDLHLRHPYRKAENGFGIEDWSWNIETLSAGVAHLIVPETVHMIRMKDAGSFGKQENAKGLLPFIPANVAKGRHQNKLLII